VSVAPLAHRLAGLHDLALERGVVADRFATLGAPGFAEELEPLLARAAAGKETERRAMLPVASWVAHTLARGEAARLSEIGAAAAGAELPFTRALFDGAEPRAALARRGRLAEVGVAVFADISGLPHRWPGETAEEWQAMRAWYMGSPAARRRLVQSRLTRTRLHHDPVFVGRLLDQRWVQVRDVVVIAARRPTVPEIVLAIATRDRWFCSASVREAIAANPYAPPALARALATVRAERGSTATALQRPLD
jgi:hypothetical protein